MGLPQQHHHFLDLTDLADGQLRQLLDAAAARKAAREDCRRARLMGMRLWTDICWQWCLKNRQPAQGCLSIWACANWAGKR